MPLMEVVLNQQYVGQECVNRWNYMASGTPAAVTYSFALLSALGFLPTSTLLADGTVGGELQSLQNVNVRFIQSLARAVFIDDDFYDNPFFSGTTGAHGDNSGAGSPLDAYGFKSSRVKQSIGRGYKRFVGTDSSYVNTGGVVGSSGLTQMELLADAMGDTLTYDDEGNTITFVPCIVQKEKYVTESGKDAYKYFATEILQAPHIAAGIDWSPYNTSRSQTSRQYGRGS